ncbi:MAG: glycosyltransferase family 39 protein [Candidatus Daviesbacteria bacterium]
MKAEPTLRFLPLSDGKTPLFMWAMIPLFKIFYDPLFAGRFLSIISGFGTLLGVAFLGWKFFSPKVGLWASFLVAILPFSVFFDRMALVDSMLTAFTIWSLNLALLLIKYPRIDLAMFLGYALGGGLLTKTPAMFNVLVVPTTLVTFEWFNKSRQTKFLRIFGLWILAFAITLIIYNILKLGPGFVNLSSRNQDYIFSPWALIDRPLDPFIPHFRDLMDWFPKLLTLPIMFLIPVGVILSLVKRNKYALTILLWSLVPLIIQMFLLKTFTARYILFSIPPLLVLGAWAIATLLERINFNKKLSIMAAIVVLAVLPLKIDFNLLISPEKVDLPRSERSGYFEAWTSGYGFPEIAQYLIDESQKGLVIVGTEGSFGTLPDGLQIYLDNHSHIAPKEQQVLIIGGVATVSAQIRTAAKEHLTFYIANKSRFRGAENLELIKEFPKAKGPDRPQDAILFYRVLPEEN